MKTTKKHFEIFKKEFQYWAEMLGLVNWSIFIDHVDLTEDGEITLANVVVKANDHIATVWLSTNWGSDTPTKEHLSQVALHEVLEILLGPLRQLARNRYVTPEQIVEANHSAIVALVNVIWDLAKGGRKQRSSKVRLI